MRKHVFYIHTNIVTKKWGEKTRDTNFNRNIRIVRKNVGKKSSKKKCENKFFKFTRLYCDQKMGGKKHETIFPEKHE